MDFWDIDASIFNSVSYTHLDVYKRQAFNTGWQFKKGPFATDPMRAASQWDGKWETVEIPHTWNAMDMQVPVSYTHLLLRLSRWQGWL